MRTYVKPLQVLTDGFSSCRRGNPRGRAIDSPGGLAYSSAMQMKKLITEKLAAAFAPQSLDVIDESHLHAGHAGHRPGGETHYRVHIVSEAFRGKSRVDRHRMINQTLSSELATTVHALAIHASAPGEG